jgi:hypothetical protein
MNLLNGFDIDLTGIDGRELRGSRLSTFDLIMKESFGQNIKIESIARLRSRKNLVLHIRLDSSSDAEVSRLIAKLFVEDTFQNELDRLTTSLQKGLTVPRVITAQDGVILMEFIPGEPLVDRINRTHESIIVELLAEWYYKYHKMHEMIKGDPRLRNFIWSNGRIFGIDFEESRKEHWMFDIAGASASILDTNPIFDARKRVLAWKLLECYLALRGTKRTSEIDTQFLDALADTLAQTAAWRKDDRLMQISNRVRSEGLEIELD